MSTAATNRTRKMKRMAVALWIVGGLIFLGSIVASGIVASDHGWLLTVARVLGVLCVVCGFLVKRRSDVAYDPREARDAHDSPQSSENN